MSHKPPVLETLAPSQTTKNTPRHTNLRTKRLDDGKGQVVEALTHRKARTPRNLTSGCPGDMRRYRPLIGRAPGKCLSDCNLAGINVLGLGVLARLSQCGAGHLKVLSFVTVTAGPTDMPKEGVRNAECSGTCGITVILILQHFQRSFHTIKPNTNSNLKHNPTWHVSMQNCVGAAHRALQGHKSPTALREDRLHLPGNFAKCHPSLWKDGGADINVDQVRSCR